MKRYLLKEQTLYISKQGNNYTSASISAEVYSIAQIKAALEKARDSVSLNPYNLFLINSARIKRENILLIITALTDLESSKIITFSYDHIDDNNVKKILVEINKIFQNKLNNDYYDYNQLNNLIKSYLGKHRLSFFQNIKQTNSIKAYQTLLKEKNEPVDQLNKLIDACSPDNFNVIDDKFNNLFKDVKANLYPNNIYNFPRAKSITVKLLDKFVDKLISDPDITMKMIKKFIEHFTPEMFINSLKYIQSKHDNFIFDFTDWELKDLIFYEYCGIDLSKLKFHNTHLENIIFYSDLVNVNFDRSNLKNVKFLNNKLNSVIFKDCRIIEFICSTTELKNVNFDRSNLENVQFNSCNMYDKDNLVVFNSIVMNNGHFINCDMHEVYFNGCTLEKVNFNKCQLHNMIFEGSKLIDTIGTILKNENIYNYDFVKSLKKEVTELCPNDLQMINDAIELEIFIINCFEEKFETYDAAKILNTNSNVEIAYQETEDEIIHVIQQQGLINNIENNTTSTRKNQVKQVVEHPYILDTSPLEKKNNSKFSKFIQVFSNQIQQVFKKK